MSLMLDALKRIEARQESARAAESASVEFVAPAVEMSESLYGALPAPGSDACLERSPLSELLEPNPTVAAAGTFVSPPCEITACAISVDDNAAAWSYAALEALIELPPALPTDPAAELSAEDIALPGEVSLESAMDELSDLLAEARRIDQPQPAPEPMVQPSPSEDPSARGAGIGWNPAAQPEANLEDGAGGAGFSWNLEMPPLMQASCPDGTLDGPSDQRRCEEEELSFGDVADLAEPWTMPEEAAATSSEAGDKCSLEATHGGTDFAKPSGPWTLPPEEDGGSGKTAHVFAEPPVIEPIGSDPYAAAVWQLLRQLPEGRSKIVLFTSPGDGHGKTITLARLLPHVARSFSGSVLAVDANTRNPDLARWLEVAVTWRLTDVLAGATHWMNAVRPTSLPRISLLPGGTDVSRQSNTHAATRLLRELAAHFDLVLVDASSLAHDGAAQLSAVCDGTCLVVRLGESSRRIVRESVRVLHRAGGRLLGCIAIDAGA